MSIRTKLKETDLLSLYFGSVLKTITTLFMIFFPVMWFIFSIVDRKEFIQVYGKGEWVIVSISPFIITVIYIVLSFKSLHKYHKYGTR